MEYLINSLVVKVLSVFVIVSGKFLKRIGLSTAVEAEIQSTQIGTIRKGFPPKNWQI